MREIAGRKTGEAELRRCVHSILGQCLYYRHSHPVLLRLHPKLHYSRKEIEALADHVADFSLAGLGRVARSGDARPKHAEKTPAGRNTTEKRNARRTAP